jgi:hypothetical protein
MTRPSLGPEVADAAPLAALGLGAPPATALSPWARRLRTPALTRSVSESYVDLPSQHCTIPDFGLLLDRDASSRFGDVVPHHDDMF